MFVFYFYNCDLLLFAFTLYFEASFPVYFSVGARNVKITSLKDRYRLEDVLNCSADGNPSPSFIWRLVRTQEPIAVGPQLALNNTRIEADQRHTIECIAQNHVAGEGKLSSATVVVIIPGSIFVYLIKPDVRPHQDT